jgi:protein-tyrosine-phosphatase
VTSADALTSLRSMPNVVFLCTGNAARSVMAGAIARAQRDDLEIVTAGTHVVEGMPMSWRTRDALGALGVTADGHRSHQLRGSDVAAADLIVALAPEHVAYVRRVHPEAANCTATLKHLARELAPEDGTAPIGTLTERVDALRLADHEVGEWEEVVDPAGGELADFEACAREIHDLLRRLAPAW